MQPRITTDESPRISEILALLLLTLAKRVRETADRTPQAGDDEERARVRVVLLARFLLAGFTQDELRRFLRTDGPAVEREVSWGRADALVVDEAVAALERRGLINRRLVRGLMRERPERAQELLDLWEVARP